MMKRLKTHLLAPAHHLRGITLGVDVLEATLALTACPGETPPIADDALGAYLNRHGIASPTATNPTEVQPPTPVIKMARRLSITVVSARDLPDLDSGPGVTDPYVMLQVDGQRHQTTTIEGSLDPVWEDSFILDVGPSPVLELTLKDEDSLSSDKTLGVVSKILQPIPVDTTIELEIPFHAGADDYVTIQLTELGPRDGSKGP